ncbi:hemicentin-1 [Plakobranchus ocellatus]|uniref:Hemicentin-1 n=1 Tax=Plakobranchus ocellatus TaxID=259542 RepID=A0AAV3YYN6_9GAST|nr:hemicentin-1 [Plakobranchus ocellatus]
MGIKCKYATSTLESSCGNMTNTHNSHVQSQQSHEQENGPNHLYTAQQRRKATRHYPVMSITCILTLATLLATSTFTLPVKAQEETEVDAGLAASLAFVFDITGSMYDDLRQVIQGAGEILDDARKRREKPLQNYVLVPFHDPVVGPVLVTEDPEEFQRELADLYVQGGGDCPEMSIGAIKEALDVSLPHSFIYVFTDARSKDYYLTDEVLTLIQQKQSQVVFVLTGDCGNVSHSGYKAYEEIAATSSGQVFLLQKSQVNQVLQFVRNAVQARKVNLLAVNEEEGRTSTFNLPLDSHLKEVTVSISGENPRIRLVDPEGKRKTLRNGLNELLDLSTVRIVNVKSPDPGTWRLRVSSSSAHTVRVTGLSHADFVSGFSKYPTQDMTATTLRPIQGIATHVLINTTGIFFPAELNDLELIDLRGLTITKFPLLQDPYNPTMYNTTPFIPPDQFFYVKVTGRDELGYTMQRITPTAISPIKPRKPRVFMADLTRGYYDKTAVLTCQVFSLVPYTVQWWHRGRQKGNDLSFGDSANVTLEIPNASNYEEGLYSCNVTNTAGYMDAVTFLDVSEPPPIINQPGNVSVLPGDTAVLTCEIYSTVIHNVTWRKDDDQYWTPFLDSRARALENGSLIIRDVNPRDEGSYSCIASNEGGKTSESLFLKLQVAPSIFIPIRQQTYTSGATRNFSCTATGHPEPTFQWQRDGEILEQSSRISYDATSGTIIFRNLGPGDQSDYECLASNSAGESSGYVRLSYIEAPRILEFDRRVLVAVGDDATLKCVADGIPLPNTTWYRSDRMLMSAYNVEVNILGQLIIRGIQDSDAGEYRCVVQNEAGSDSSELVLEVGAPPEIVHPPENVGIDIGSNGTLPCQAIGRPLPKLSWRRADGKPIDFSSRFRQLPSGSLQINRISPGDEGIYTCVAQNAFGLADAAAYVSVTGIVRPLIAYTQPFVKAIEGEDAELECVVLLGKPKPTLTWMRKGQRLRESSRVRFSAPGRVVINSVDKADDGDYLCMASNIGGNETYTINLDVLVPPRLLLDDELDRQTRFSVIQGRSVLLPCSVTADPAATFTWFKDGLPISLTEARYYIRNNGALQIFSAELDDAALYKCVASNVAGEVEKNMELFVEVLPRISGALDETIEININESVLLPCEVEGTPAPTVKWNKNFSPLDVAASDRVQVQRNGLYITRAQIDDKAIYECVASNVAGDVNKIITLIVYIPPTLEPGPSNVTVLYGLSVTLECEAQGDPAPTVLWKKDGVILDVNDPDRGYYRSLQGSLTLEAATLRDGGRYSCTATNPAGVLTRQITLSVLGAPEINGPFPDYVDVVEYNPLILPCPAEGTPPPTITWYKSGQPLTGAELGVVQLDDGALEIKRAEAEDSGTYRCLAENIAGIAERSVIVKVLVPPKLAGLDGPSAGPDKVSVIAKNNVTLTCPVSPDTDPPPFITWYKDREPIRETERVFLSNQARSLTITIAEVEDEARYKCKAVNPAGEVEKYFDLDVQVPPQIDESGVSPFNQSVIAGETLYINCPIQGKPLPKTNKEKCSRDRPKGGENDGSIGDYSMLTETAPRTTRTMTTMDYSCICGRRFATERGMKIHTSKMGCLSMSSQQQRTAIAGKTLENQSQVQNHSAKETKLRTETMY